MVYVNKECRIFMVTIKMKRAQRRKLIKFFGSIEFFFIKKRDIFSLIVLVFFLKGRGGFGKWKIHDSVFQRFSVFPVDYKLRHSR